MKHTGWIATERSVRAHETRPDGRALAATTGYQASYRYGSHQSITRGWMPPMHQTDTLFHKKTGAMGFVFGFDVDNHAINTVPKETGVLGRRLRESKRQSVNDTNPTERNQTMNATEILTSEHAVIEQVLDCLEKLVERGEANLSYDWHPANQMIDFLRHFADECHHAKEEQQLFPALEQRGFSPQFGPTGVMRHEHEQGRGLIAAMADCVQAGLRGDNRNAHKFASHAKSYVNLLRQHIHKEDHCLFKMADRVLSDADQNQLVEAFDHVEHAPELVGRHEHYLELANKLAEQFGVRRATTKALHVAGCCGHHN